MKFVNILKQLHFLIIQNIYIFTKTNFKIT